MSREAIELTIGERAYKFAPLGRGITLQFEAWARGILMAEALEALGPMAIASERAAMISRMMGQTRTLAADEMNSYRGQAKLFELMLKKHQPDMTPDEIDEVLESFGIKEAMALIDNLAGFSDEEMDETAMRKTLLEFGLDKAKKLLKAMEAETKRPLSPSAGMLS